MNRYLFAAILLFVGWAPAQEKGVPAGYKAHKNLEYGPHERHRLDVFTPEAVDKARPLIVWIHGGGWQAGSKESVPALSGLLAKGFTVASINYRYTKTDPHPAQVHDCKGAIRWLRAHAKDYGIDPQKFGVMGASAGGHLVTMLGVTAGMSDFEGTIGGNAAQSSRVQAVCNWFGPTDFLNWKGPKDVVKGGTADNAIDRLMGGPIAQKMDVAKAASPITHITKDCPPILFVHGDKDPLVPLFQSQTMHEALKKKAIDSSLHVVKDGTHGGGFGTPEVAKAITDFFERTLKK